MKTGLNYVLSLIQEFPPVNNKSKSKPTSRVISTDSGHGDNKTDTISSGKHSSEKNNHDGNSVNRTSTITWVSNVFLLKLNFTALREDIMKVSVNCSQFKVFISNVCLFFLVTVQTLSKNQIHLKKRNGMKMEVNRWSIMENLEFLCVRCMTMKELKLTSLALNKVWEKPD